jgi:hypothetical protein
LEHSQYLEKYKTSEGYRSPPFFIEKHKVMKAGKKI